MACALRVDPVDGGKEIPASSERQFRKRVRGAAAAGVKGTISERFFLFLMSEGEREDMQSCAETKFIDAAAFQGERSFSHRQIVIV